MRHQPRNPWDAYFDQVAQHLTDTRIAIERGQATPPAPVSPSIPMPESYRDRARLAALGYDQLAAEVTHRMREIRRLRPVPSLTPRRTSRFIDRPA